MKLNDVQLHDSTKKMSGGSIQIQFDFDNDWHFAIKVRGGEDYVDVGLEMISIGKLIVAKGQELEKDG